MTDYCRESNKTLVIYKLLNYLFNVVSGRLVGPDSTCREKLEKTIILYTKVVSCHKRTSFFFHTAPENFTLSNCCSLFVSSFVWAVARFSGAASMRIYPSHPAFPGIRCELCVYTLWGRSYL